MQHTFTADDTWVTRKKFFTNRSKKILKYSGDLGGGTLRIYSESYGFVTPVPDSKLSIDTVDSNGDAIQEIVFLTTGKMIIELTGSTNPNVTVMVL